MSPQENIHGKGSYTNSSINAVISVGERVMSPTGVHPVQADQPDIGWGLRVLTTWAYFQLHTISSTYMKVSSQVTREGAPDPSRWCLGKNTQTQNQLVSHTRHGLEFLAGREGLQSLQLVAGCRPGNIHTKRHDAVE